MLGKKREGRPTRQDDAPNAAKTLHRSFYLTGAIPSAKRAGGLCMRISRA